MSPRSNGWPSISAGWAAAWSRSISPPRKASTSFALQSDRPIDALLANAGVGLGKAFLDQDFARIRHVVDTNITGTLYLIHRAGNEMLRRKSGRVLITGSVAGSTPGSFQAVYNASKAFLDSFSFALREELRDSGVTVTCLMPGATDTEFFRRADMMDTKVGAEKKDGAYGVAKAGFDAMLRGEADVVTGLKNKIQTTVANVTPNEMLARQHRKLAEPGRRNRKAAGTGSSSVPGACRIHCEGYFS